MIILGLTGSIGMGKSTTAQMFREFGARVYDADATVHALYEKGGAAVPLIEEAFLGVSVEGAVDRGKLREYVIGKPEALKKLESLVHPLTGKAQLEFLKAAEEAHAPYIVLDVPLLYEVGANENCNAVIVVTASSEVQRDRVMSREGMTEDVFRDILSKQIPDAQKRALADFIISTGFGFQFAREQVQAIHNLMLRTAEENEANA